MCVDDFCSYTSSSFFISRLTEAVQKKSAHVAQLSAMNTPSFIQQEYQALYNRQKNRMSPMQYPYARLVNQARPVSVLAHNAVSTVPPYLRFQGDYENQVLSAASARPTEPVKKMRSYHGDTGATGNRAGSEIHELMLDCINNLTYCDKHWMNMSNYFRSI